MDATTLTRRTLIRSGAAAGATLLLTRPWSPVWAWADTPGAPAYLSRSSYAGLAGQSFNAVAADGSSVVLTLDAIGDLTDAAAGADDAFALALSGSASPSVGQGPLTLSHPQLGAFELFVAAVDQPGATQGYEIVVDRSRGVDASQFPTAPAQAPAPAAAAAVVPSASTPRAAEHAIPRSVRHATLRRSGHGLVLHLEFDHGSGVRRVDLHLQHHGRTLAHARRAVHAAALTVHVQPEHAISRGEYDLLTITTGRDGSVVSQQTAVRLG